MDFNKILEKYRKDAFSERDKGDRFERLMQAYLYTDPKYTHLKKIWLWNEFPYRAEFGGHDVGIDLVAQTAEGEYWAIQCKCYQEDARINKDEVDTFLSTSGRSFEDGEKNRVKFERRIWISTTNNWSSKAEDTLQNQDPPVTRINLTDLTEAPVEWGEIDSGVFGEKARTAKKELRYHQREALHSTASYFKHQSRGKLIMACGTGKTFTSLRIAEQEAGEDGVVLFLVPSIALLGQTLREWTGDANEEINAIAICSDSEITRVSKKSEDSDIASVVDLAVPASTNVKSILKQFEYFEMMGKKGMTVVFSTYQSIEVISATQKRLESIGSKYSKFDLIVCDEAHRTTGVTLADNDESSFVKVHDNSFINSDKRLYMTATPRLYGDDSKRKAEESSATICSMDDPALYGEEIYRIGFGEAVERDLLSDYKVLILTLSENDVTPEVQKVLQNSEHEIGIDDASKLIGCINAMSKQILSEKGNITPNDPNPMRRAVAFTPSIKTSKKITASFNDIGDTYFDSVPDLKKETLVNLKSKHIDGTMSATDRDKLMSWLKAEPSDSHEARILTNVRCLSEGVDVPSLDAVMFLSAKNSQVDVVQSVGRVMRKSPGKQYGYIIIPIVVPTDVKPEDALNDNERFKVVWTVLNALRAHDDRFNATVNKIDLNKNRPDQILVGRPDPDGDGDPFNDSDDSKKSLAETTQTSLHFNQLQTAIYAKMVQKVGDRQYWENWAKNVADIAERQITRITKLVNEDDAAHMAFREFVRGLRKNINPSIDEQQAIEMLSQHIITKPVFEALFEGYSFVQNNAVSISMQKALDAIEAQALEDVDAELLDGFYKSVRKRAEGIDNAEGKQRIIVELYDKFFKNAFPKMVEQLGIVYTPLEVVDFIIHSVNDVLQKEFGRSLSDENVNILDPFTGTGTFITRLLQSGVIKPEDLERKYKQEIFANEIVLLAYYIAAVNIENTYHDLLQKDAYESFEGIVLTDTFQLSENENEKIFSDAMAENSERAERQKKAPLRVIIGNPPYSVGQKSANDDAQNQKYQKLDSRIEQTYAKNSQSGLKASLYDSYIKAFRWATDRLSDEGGIIGYVSNGSWVDVNTSSGFRRSLEKELTSIYVFNLRGNQRTSGEVSRREGGKIFGSGSRTPISITILVKDPGSNKEKADIYYYDIGDYLNREEKLSKISNFSSAMNQTIDWTKLEPNEHGDWINMRSNVFVSLIPLVAAKGSSQRDKFFDMSSLGISTNRDAWCYNSNKDKLTQNIRMSVDFYNSERTRIQRESGGNKSKMEKLFVYDSTKANWTDVWKNNLSSNNEQKFDKSSVTIGLYRPFFKQNLYYSRFLNHRVYQQPRIFPEGDSKNLVICSTGAGSTKDYSLLITDVVPNLDSIGKTVCLPLYYYEKNETNAPSLFDNSGEQKYVRHDGISDFIYDRAKSKYQDSTISKEDIFYYVYGLLHSPDYRNNFTNDLKKMLPHLPLVDNSNDFWVFSKAGRTLASLHINYEEVPEYEGAKVSGTQHANYIVEKLKFIKKGQRDTILYNHQIKIENIPEKAYEYVINGKSAIEWIIDRYQVTTHKDSGIVNDPNDWAKQVGNPRYILDLLLSVISVSVQTVDIVNTLPELSFKDSEAI
jgi:predicted helicase